MGLNVSRVFSLWIGPKLSIYEKLTLASAIKFQHVFTLFCYEPIDVPSGIIMADANEIIPREQIQKVNNSFAAFSNNFRYRALDLGKYGSWIDMDIVFSSKYIPSDRGYTFGFENENIINNAVLNYPVNSILSRKLIQESNSLEAKWGATGPLLLTKIIQQEALRPLVQKRDVFYPIGPWEVDLLLSSRKVKIIEKKIANSHTIHLWMNILQRFGFPKDKLPPKNSYLRILLEEFGLIDPTLLTLSKVDLVKWNLKFMAGKIKHLLANIARKVASKMES